MEQKALIAGAIKENTGQDLLKLSPLGKGATSSAFLAQINDEPKQLAVKISRHAELLKREQQMLDFLSPLTCYKVPKTYFFCNSGENAVLAMEYISGVGGNSKRLLFMPGKNSLAEDIIRKFKSTTGIHGEKFGKFDNPKYDNWKDYYLDFFGEIYEFAKFKAQQNQLSDTAVTALEKAKSNFDVIFAEPTGKPCPCHGDLWLNNMIIDPKSKTLAGVLDPFDSLWAEPEYELLALTLGFGKTLKLYERYKAETMVSKYCDLKVELYALVNELHWYKQLGSIGHGYIDYRAKRLIRKIEGKTGSV
ncbi:MAG: aminoglycoside phosphotransferase family protein [Acutalibacteraceae bacterium]